ncbi:NAD(+) kinase [Thermosipho atlanticus]|uniref:NAD kinase n=1 Tax=Thermosipho atlanticus DSM 15807 TaxID=1123380 RepID=A0A1M5R4V9_9BACT|nr:NAD(+) kinase [Thermosipho atlanticus]SHH21146.1 NAD+ kinase [Thermosipho atlanticus DSM 15807]
MKVFGIFYKPGLKSIVDEFVQKLKKKNAHIVFLTSNEKEIEDHTDLTLVIGGDGTVLKAAKYVSSPIIGFKGGRLGFLSSYTIDEFDKFLEHLESNSFYEDKRQFFEVLELNSLYLNDIVAIREPHQKMLDINVKFKDGSFYFHADGIIISTPTGSTAYSLSLGGPILLPNVKAYVLTPIAPQFLASRSVILPDDEKISVETSFPSHLIVDGHDFGKFNKFSVRKSEKSITILRPLDYDFSKSIKEKMGYGKNYFK